MEKPSLRELLELLHKELEVTETVDENARGLLQCLAKDVQEVLHRSGEPEIHHFPPMRERLVEAIEYFEASHPTLTAEMGRVVHTLNQMGI